MNPDGSSKWTFADPDGGTLQTAPALDASGVLYGAFSRGSIKAINPDGTQKWSMPVQAGKGGLDDAESHPIIGLGGSIFVGVAVGFLPEDHRFLAISYSGALLWATNATYYIDSSAAIGDDGTVYAGLADRFSALDPSNAATRWTLPSSTLPSSMSEASSPAIGDNGTIYISLDGRLVAIESGSRGPAPTSWPMHRQNARRTGRVSRPRLSLRLEGSSYLISWPAAYESYALESAVSLNRGKEEWAALKAEVAELNGMKRVVLAPHEQVRFFRLRSVR